MMDLPYIMGVSSHPYLGHALLIPCFLSTARILCRLYTASMVAYGYESHWQVPLNDIHGSSSTTMSVV